MGGGLMQLVAYGAQDIYLTGNPQITFFKVVYRRHTNFSMECIEQTWNGTSAGASGANGRCTATVSRNGDLVHGMHLEVDIIGGTTTTVQNPMATVINSLELTLLPTTNISIKTDYSLYIFTRCRLCDYKNLSSL